MGFFDVLGEMVKDGVNSSLGLADSNENTIHDYVYDGCRNLESDKDYAEFFRGVAKALLAKNRADGYLYEIACTSNWLYWGAEVQEVIDEFSKALWRLRYRDRWGNFKYIQIRLESPKAFQLKYDGSYLSVGYETTREEKPFFERKDSHLVSFLGVRFGEDYHQFAEGPDSEDGGPPQDCDGPLQGMMRVHAKRFRTNLPVEFAFILFNKRTEKVCGIMVWVRDSAKRLGSELFGALGVRFESQGENYIGRLVDNGSIDATCVVREEDEMGGRCVCSVSIFSTNYMPSGQDGD